MTTTLSEGVKVPDVGSVNWAGDLEVNWNLLNGALANLSGNVKVDRDNTWTGEQSFTLPIVGSITGTAAKAIADEDGTSIKTGYVNVAGNQTVSGQKTWSGNQFFTSAVYHKSTTYEIGNFPASNIVTNIYFADKNNVYSGFTRSVIYSSGRTATELRAKNLFKNGVLDATGSEITSSLNVEVQPDGSKTLYFDGSIRNNVLPYTTTTYSLGSSSYQWSSVYAQSYYYNGVAWGLDKANVWTNTQTYSAGSYGQKILLKNTGLDLSVNGNTGLSDTYQHVISWVDKNNTIYSSIQSWASDANNTLVLRSYYRTDASTSRNLSVRFVNTATNKSVYPETNADADLGTSTNKWKSLNGVNPGALSFPDMVNFIDVSGSIVPPSGESTINYSGGQNTFMPLVDGWLSIRLDGASFLQIYRNAYNCPGTTVSEPSGTRKLVTTLPVKAGVTYIIVMNGNPTETRFHLYPCLGNV